MIVDVTILQKGNYFRTIPMLHIWGEVEWDIYEECHINSHVSLYLATVVRVVFLCRLLTYPSRPDRLSATISLWVKGCWLSGGIVLTYNIDFDKPSFPSSDLQRNRLVIAYVQHSINVQTTAKSTKQDVLETWNICVVKQNIYREHFLY